MRDRESNNTENEEHAVTVTAGYGLLSKLITTRASLHDTEHKLINAYSFFLLLPFLHHQTKKKTLAQFRLEKERRERDFDLGCQLANDVINTLNAFTDYGATYDVRDDALNALLAQADRAVSLLQNRPDTGQYRLILGVKGDTHKQLGQHNAAEATFRQADEAFAMAERNGTLTGQGYNNWLMSLIQLGNLYLSSQQRESAKRCFLRVLDMPHQRARDRGGALQGLAD